jgi:hypothetical protein
MGYIKSTEPSSTQDMIGSPRSEASGIPLRSYETGATFTELDEFAKFEKGRA